MTRFRSLSRSASLVACALAACGAARPAGARPQAPRVSAGDTVRGSLGDRDPVLEGHGAHRRLELRVEESGPVTISLDSADFDALLRVEDEAGKPVAEDDDGSGETNSRLVLAARAGRSYGLIAAAKAGGAGEFVLAVRAGEPPARSIPEQLDLGIAFRARAAERAVERGDLRAAAGHRIRQATLCLGRSRLPEAREAFRAALAHALESGDSPQERRAIAGLGAVHQLLGSLARARPFHEKRRAQARAAGDIADEAAALINLGAVASSLADFPQAKRLLGEGLTLARSAGQRRWEANALGNLGDVHLGLGEYGEAQACHRARLELVRAIGDRAGEAAALRDLGNLFLRLGDHGKARDHYERDLELCRALGDRAGEAAALVNLGTAHTSAGDYPRAIETLEAGRRLARETHHRQWEANALGNLGLVHAHLGRNVQARSCFEEQLDLVRGLGDRDGETAARLNLGQVLSSLGEYRQAIELFESALQLAREAGLRPREVVALGALGDVHRLLGDAGRARDEYERQLALARSLGHRASEAAALGSLGVLDFALGECGRAEERLEAQLGIALEIGDRKAAAGALAHLGDARRTLGELGAARKCHARSLDLFRVLGDPVGQAAALANVGLIHHALAEYEAALACHQEGLALSRASGDRRGEARAFVNLGAVFAALGEPLQALECFERHLELARALGDRSGEATALGNLGAVRQQLGEYEQALESYRRRVEFARQVGDRTGTARALANLAGIHAARGDRESAREAAEAAAAALGQETDAEVQLVVLAELASAAIARGDAAAALEALSRAEALLDRPQPLELEISERASRRSRFARLGALAQDAISLRLRQAGNDRDATARIRTDGLVAASRWKGRSLVEGMREHRTGGRTAEVIRLRRASRELEARRESVLRRIAGAIHDGAAPEAVDALREEAAGLEADAGRLRQALRDSFPEEAALDAPRCVDLDALAAAVITPETALIEFADGTADLVAYVLSRDGLRRLDLGPRSEIDAAAAALRACIAEPDRLGGPSEVAQAGRAAFDQLLAAPLREVPTAVRRLVIVPTAGLAAVPFDALVPRTRDDRVPQSFGDIEFVLDRFEVSYAPATSVLVELQRRGSRAGPDRALLLGDPIYPGESGLEMARADGPPGNPAGGAARGARRSAAWDRLPQTRDEVIALARLLGGPNHDAETEASLRRLASVRSGSIATAAADVHLGSEASRTRLEGALGRYSLLHVAAHGFVDASAPERSALVLSRDGGDAGVLSLGDVADLDLDANLVVLSACETARGRQLAGEGIQSLARAFLFAGSRAVVATLWNVADRATAELMRTFYGHLQRGESISASIRLAKLRHRRGTAVRPDGDERDRGVGGVAASAPRLEGDAASWAHPYYWAAFVGVGLPR
jgi:CHAT domain-containing protein/tetratricopeptide (TPR) repeat protein